MIQFKTLNLTALIEILSDFTFHYKQMLTTGSDKVNIESTRSAIHLLQSEIDYRKRTIRNL